MLPNLLSYFGCIERSNPVFCTPYKMNINFYKWHIILGFIWLKPILTTFFDPQAKACGNSIKALLPILQKTKGFPYLFSIILNVYLKLAFAEYFLAVNNNRHIIWWLQ